MSHPSGCFTQSTRKWRKPPLWGLTTPFWAFILPIRNFNFSNGTRHGCWPSSGGHKSGTAKALRHDHGIRTDSPAFAPFGERRVEGALPSGNCEGDCNCHWQGTPSRISWAIYPKWGHYYQTPAKSPPAKCGDVGVVTKLEREAATLRARRKLRADYERQFFTALAKFAVRVDPPVDGTAPAKPAQAGGPGQPPRADRKPRPRWLRTFRSGLLTGVRPSTVPLSISLPAETQQWPAVAVDQWIVPTSKFSWCGLDFAVDPDLAADTFRIVLPHRLSEPRK